MAPRHSKIRALSLRHPLLGAALALVAAFAPSTGTQAQAADAVRIQQLELDIRDLQRSVRAQARRIEELERALAQYRVVSSGPGARGQPLKPPGEEWLQSKNWERVKPGMKAQDAIAILGEPASMRESEDGRRKLLYAMQLGASGFLAGNVVIEDDRVVEVTRPVLK